MKHPLTNKNKRQRYYSEYLKKSDNREGRFLFRFRRYLYKQLERVVKQIQDSSDIRFIKNKGFDENVFNESLEVNLLIDVIFPFLEDLMQEVGEDAMNMLGESNFDMTTDIRKWLDYKVKVFAKSVTETTFKKLKKEFKESFDKNEGRKTLIKRIERTYKDISKGRAKTIARTEVQGATQNAVFEGYKQANVPTKIWVATPDEKTRDTHRTQDGEERALNQSFSNGLMYPGDPNGAPSEIINCRCTI